MQTPNVIEFLMVPAWIVAIMASVIVLVLFGKLDRLDGVIDRFFSTRLRSFVTCESIGLIGSASSLLIAPMEFVGIVLLTALCSIAVVLAVLTSSEYYHDWVR